MIRHIFFDLGETLIQYYSRGQFQATLPVLFDKMYSALKADLIGPREQYWLAMQAENHESPDYSVRKLELRLATVFGISEEAVLRGHLCDLFLSELLAASSLYPDTVPTLQALSGHYQMALVSNTPWGSPKHYFQRELDRYGLDKYIRRATFCRDVGYRKPHRSIFEHALVQSGATAGESIIVGDRYEWDVVGAQACGMTPILVDRAGGDNHDCARIGTLSDLLEIYP